MAVSLVRCASKKHSFTLLLVPSSPMTHSAQRLSQGVHTGVNLHTPAAVWRYSHLKTSKVGLNLEIVKSG